MIELFSECKSHYAADSFDETATGLIELFLHLADAAKIRDEWDFHWNILGNGIYVIATSQKKHHAYCIGFYANQFYINSGIYNPRFLKSMKAEFWNVLSSLDLMDFFSFQENAGIERDVKFDLKTSKSSVYSLVRNYVLLEEHSTRGATDIGNFESIWYLGDPDEIICEQAVESLKGIYRLNYLLYRNEYLRNHKKK